MVISEVLEEEVGARPVALSTLLALCRKETLL